jgi:hypothetical protein
MGVCHLVDWSNEVPPNSELGYEPVCDVARRNPLHRDGLDVTVELVTATWMYGCLYHYKQGVRMGRASILLHLLQGYLNHCIS